MANLTGAVMRGNLPPPGTGIVPLPDDYPYTYGYNPYHTVCCTRNGFQGP